MNWSKGDASTLPAQVGFNFGGEDMVDSYTLPGYGMKNVYDSISNVKTPGHLIYRIDDVVSQPYSKSSNGKQIYIDTCIYHSMYVYFLS